MIDENGDRMKVTAKAISKELGISIATVDRVLNNRPNVSNKMRNRVLEKAEELGYVPNRMASMLSKKVTFTVAIIYREYPAYFWEQVELGIDQAGQELRDYGVTVHKWRLPWHEFFSNPDSIRELIKSGTYDAFAIAGGDTALVQLLDSSEVPYCTFNEDALNSNRQFYVGSDYQQAGKLAAELLAKLVVPKGKIGVLANVPKEQTLQVKEKLTGFKKGLEEYGLTIAEVIWEEMPFKGKDILDKLRQFDGLYIATAELGEIAEELYRGGHKLQALVGHDMNEVVYKHLHSNTISATITQDPVSQGYLAIKKLFDFFILEDQSANHTHLTKLEVVLKGNASFYL